MSIENTAFSSSGEDAIARTIDVEVDDTAHRLQSTAEFDAFYEIERTANEIQAGNFKRVALQFPDELLHDSVQIFRRLKRNIGPDKELYVAAQHIDANAVVHYGHACMSQTYRLPVIYVFGKKSIDVEDCVTRLLDTFASSGSDRRKHVVFRHDVAYTHQAGQIVARLREALENSESQVFYTPIPDKLLPSQNESMHVITPTIQESTIFYVGDESLGLTNLLMTHSSCDVYRYSPASKTTHLESGRTNKLLMRRYAAMQKGRDADVFGILVGTLGVASYLPLIKHLRSLLAASHKKSYTISVGKLNPAKLANFMEIECFVLVACPENSLVDAKDFYRPIVTPYELEVALQAEQSWTGKYVLDFGQLLAEYARNDDDNVRDTQADVDRPTEPGDAVERGDEEGNEEDGDSPVFSLVTGKYRHAKRFGFSSANGTQNTPSPDPSSSTLVKRNQEGMALAVLKDSAAGEIFLFSISRCDIDRCVSGQYLQTRSYQGLDPRVGQDVPGALEQGRSGIARGYGGSEEESKK
ncbi:hypothetical protein GYMLUDRAFT_57148 [Collybiopsis luxurians FD-317 M1]|uniref:2-(3-amino-3-carboxypropyl)histidine synthase subunit 2 n=1 Tax=Collybiopsis luxurians FD-317 M1 TaxID=944289 RepID=A0A0D0D484_9AGAR|nr:hypothetical protein GYMLUDRAFT_57148 [Collybiopsis luxurians FD-317 M1]